MHVNGMKDLSNMKYNSRCLVATKKSVRVSTSLRKIHTEARRRKVTFLTIAEGGAILRLNGHSGGGLTAKPMASLRELVKF